MIVSRTHTPLVAPMPDQPPITVLVCTRNRGSSITQTIKSLLASDYFAFDLLIIDQSTNDETLEALKLFQGDERVRYVRSDSKGLGLARNIGLALATSDIVVMTDDDCEVQPSWVREMVAGFQLDHTIGLVFCDVVAIPHDSTKGYVPVSLYQESLLIESLKHWKTTDGCNIGIGAGMAVRLAAARQIGGFDESLGAGSRFRSGEDLDFALRILAGNYQIYRTNTASVLHYGFRTHDEGRKLIRDCMFSIGVIYGKLIKCGYWRVFPYYLSVFQCMVIAPMITSLTEFSKPQVVGRALGLLSGLFAGLGTEVNRQKITFCNTCHVSSNSWLSQRPCEKHCDNHR